MSFLTSVKEFFSGTALHVRRGIEAARSRGLDDALVDLALKWARVAVHQFADNDQRRAFVIKMLVTKGVPEAVARLAVELAVAILKRELQDGV